MEQGAEMTTGSIPMDCILDRLTAEDDPAAWIAILSVVSEEFAERYLAERGRKESWFLRIGACSHWWRPQSRWTAAGGFAWPVGYKDASGWSHGLPEFDWSVILSFDGEQWQNVGKFGGKKQIALHVAVPSRTARHKQAAVHSIWSTSRELTFYGFRNFDGKWVCVAASDEQKHGRILDKRLVPNE